ncbi:hypothetical protein SLEP1_g34554 [Rubroshorea leprosula]|uniref:Uncharacterized protein n=1 Tax=Rubroshorea leprosula TaxID=152421 RepID=A0AAV5KKA6_9ROSI|nr:hypothetical protein SLEP1_g34554 [Rubroshorea leprosula]
MPRLCECVTSKEETLSIASNTRSLPSLMLSSSHVVEHEIPTTVITQSIDQEASKWCSSIDHVGMVSFLSGLWDWSNYVAKMLSCHRWEP